MRPPALLLLFHLFACGESKMHDELPLTLDDRPPPMVPADAPLVVQPDTPPADTTPRVLFAGRFDRTDPNAPKCAWSGCRIVASFAGSRVVVSLAEEVRTGGPSEWEVRVDGAVSTLVTAPGTSSYLLADGLGAEPHTVEMRKRNEAQSGATRFLGFDFGDGALLVPPPPRRRRIEIVGDGGASGAGIVPDACSISSTAARSQDFGLTFGARLGDIFDADVAGTVFTGKGLVRNALAGDRETLPVLYGRADPLDATRVQDPSSFSPDALVVMVGESDFASSALAPATSLAAFLDAYRAFVTTLRTQHPGAHVFLVASPLLSDASGAARTNVLAAIRAVRDAFAAKGDAHVHAVVPAPAAAAERTGCGGAGNAALHERVAGELAAAIRPILEP